jgi:hypothetical protein
MYDRIHALLVFVLWLALVTFPTGGAGYPQGSVNDSTNGQIGAPIMWREPTDIEHRDLFYGIGGKENAPDPSVVYRLVRPIKEGTQPKIIVADDKGRTWILKTGPEAKPETTSTRIVWAAGYYVDPDYFIRSIQIVGDTSFIKEDVRFERFEPAESDLGHWSWKSNPFLGTRELDGLKVLVALLRDVDLKEANNQIRRITWDGSANNVYYIADLGSTLGSTGTAWNKIPFLRNLPADHGNHNTEKANPDRFASGSLINKVDREKVVFRSQRSSVTNVLRGVSVDNAKWMGEILSRLSDAQLSDAFRAGGFDDDEIQVYVSTLRNRIDELRKLTGPSLLQEPVARR